jgi:hypothetical protein
VNQIQRIRSAAAGIACFFTKSSQTTYSPRLFAVEFLVNNSAGVGVKGIDFIGIHELSTFFPLEDFGG